MASAQKKSNARGGSSGRSGSGKSTQGKRTQSQSKGKQAKGGASAPAKRPIRREVGGVICLLLAFFGAIGYFDVEALFIDLFRDLFQGLFGYGYYLVPPVLLLAAYILLFHRGRPVRLRLTSALSVPVLVGAILHLILSRAELAWDGKLLGQLWTTGQAGSSGGAVSGLIGMALESAVSQIGALVVLIVVAFLAVLYAFNRTVLDLFRAARERRENRAVYDREEPEETKEEETSHSAQQHPKQGAHTRRSAIDIPVDDGPLTAKAPTKPVTTVRKKKLFDKISSVPAPDEVLTGVQAPRMEEEPPEYEDVPEIRPMSDLRTAPAAERQTPPPVVREPAVEKVSRQEAQQAHDEVTREIEENLEQEPPAYRYPPISLLNEGTAGSASAAAGELHANQQRLEDTLQSFGVDAHIVNAIRGPSVTRYELELEQGVKLNKITNLSNDIALALGASAVRVAPIPDKISTVGIEVPNRQVTPVAIREVIGSKAFIDSKSKVSFAVGKDIAGNCIVGNIAKLPHMLIAGTTGSGKSVCTNSLIVSLLYKATPDEVRLIMVDPKMVELGVYNGIPHLLIPVVTDPKKAAGALQWAVSEMMKRYKTFSEVGAKDLTSYNNHARKEGRDTMPQIVVVIDELADLMLVAAKEVEESICRVAQMGRASGMHLIIATQSPRADVITGLMKANIPSRIAFAVASSLESRIILDTTGAEKLVGKGDMLYAPLGQDKLRVQGCFISEEEVANVVDFIKEGATARYDESVMHEIEKHAEEKEKGAKGVGGSDPTGGGGDDYDELLPAAIEVVLEVGQASVSMLQRRLKLGYGRAARLVDQMEEKGVVGPFEGSKPRQLLITKEQWQEMQYRRGMDGPGPEPVPDELPFEGDAVPQGRDAPPFDADE